MIDKAAFLEMMQRRHACKAYDPKERINDEDMQFILEAARLSPSSFGFEPWRFLLIENRRIRELIRDKAWGAKDKVMDCSRFVVILARLAPDLQADSDYISHMMRDVHQLPEDIIALRREFYRQYISQEAKLTENPRAFYDWASKQTYIALANMMNAAAAIGIDSTPIEGFDYEQLNQCLVEQGLYAAQQFRISLMCAFGKAINPARPKTRQAYTDIVEII